MSATDSPPDKPEFRERFRAARLGLTPADREQMDQSIVKSLLSSGITKKAGAIAAYAAFNGEPDLSDALAQWALDDKALFLPVIHEGHEMSFRRWRPGDAGQTNRFGIMEPVNGKQAAVTDLDLVLMPLVAWNTNGTRLGMGAGYYDRALSGVRDAKRPLRIGVGYQLQESEQLPSDPWDVRLHAMVTEHGWFTCG